MADSLFRASGLAGVSYFPFEARAWQRDSVGLELASRDSTYRPDCVALAHSPVAASVEAPLLDLGNGLQADHDRLAGQVRGRLVLVNLGLVDAPRMRATCTVPRRPRLRSMLVRPGSSS
jgi:hypothetical protein